MGPKKVEIAPGEGCSAQRATTRGLNISGSGCSKVVELAVLLRYSRVFWRGFEGVLVKTCEGLSGFNQCFGYVQASNQGGLASDFCLLVSELKLGHYNPGIW